MTIGEVVAALIGATDKGEGPRPEKLDGVVVEEARQVKFSPEGPVLVVRCIIGHQDAGGVAMDAEGETWVEALRLWRQR